MQMASSLLLLIGYFPLLLTHTSHRVHGDVDECTRHPPPPPDCSTYEIPTCLVDTGEGSGEPEYLEFPLPNTRTCYRTCIVEKSGLFGDECWANLTGVHNQNIRKTQIPGGSTLQGIFTPNYHKNKDYRKSTICRYNLQCEPGHELSYSYVEHSLEQRHICSYSNECIDWVSVHLPFYGTSQKTCAGEAQLNTVYQDGIDSLHAEFVANRDDEYPGVYIAVWCTPLNNLALRLPGCTAPDGPSTRDVGTGSDYVGDSDYGGDSRSGRDTHDSETSDSDAIVRQVNTSLIPTAIWRPRNIQLTVQRDEWVTYRAYTLFIRDQNQSVLRYYTGIASLSVSNRVVQRATFQGESRGNFKGYGHLTIRWNRATFRQKGVHPMDRPTSAELFWIVQFQRRLLPILADANSFDVADRHDEPTVSHNRERDELFLLSDRILIRAALHYGNACNALLRAASCAYQLTLLRRDCRSPVNISSPQIDIRPYMNN